MMRTFIIDNSSNEEQEAVGSSQSSGSSVRSGIILFFVDPQWVLVII